MHGSTGSAGGRLAELAWLPVLACFLTLRLFSPFGELPLINDQPKYLALADSFPTHVIYDDQPWLMHSPVVGWIVGVFALVLPTVIAGLLVTVLAGTANFFLTRTLGRELGLNAAGQAAALLVLALTELLVWTDSQIGRMGVLMTFSLAAVLSLVRHLDRGARGLPGWTTLWLCLALATSEQALVLFPVTALLCWARRSTLRIPRGVLASWLLGGAAFALWPAFRLWVFLTHDHYPAGIDGTVESLRTFPLGALLQPNMLPVTESFREFFTVTSFSLANLTPASLVVFAKWFTVPRSLAVAVCVLLSGIGLLLGKARERSAAWWLAAVALLFFAPPLFGMYDRYGVGYVFFFALLAGWGAHHASRRVPRGEAVLAGLAAAVALVVTAAWLARDRPPEHYSPVATPPGGRHFLFAREPVVAGEELARYLDALPGDGVMAPIGTVPSLAYQIGKRVLALPIHPERLLPLLRDYRIQYVVIARDLLAPTGRTGFDLATSRNTAQAIAGDPDRFEPLETFAEQRPYFFRPREYLVYRVRS